MQQSATMGDSLNSGRYDQKKYKLACASDLMGVFVGYVWPVMVMLAATVFVWWFTHVDIHPEEDR